MVWSNDSICLYMTLVLPPADTAEQGADTETRPETHFNKPEPPATTVSLFSYQCLVFIHTHTHFLSPTI